MALYDVFPYLKDEKIIIKKMDEMDLAALREITGNPKVYKYCPYFLYKKSDGNLRAAIRNCSGRDFEKRKHIIAGIYLSKEPARMVGIAEMFDYSKRNHCITIGYKVNEKFWHQGIATHAVSLIKNYLFTEDEVSVLHAYVMPENVYSEKALMSNGFEKLLEQIEQKNWGGMENVMTDHFRLEKHDL